ncbi:ABC transporter ATP-binding protein [Dinoroseobacter sp. S76]|uniref:ABC transporter ATP-binding protein n=1 Tax=Dinoroseobacter sp. S76 TaxID=3415124 RepID=UPI003C7CB2A5
MTDPAPAIRIKGDARSGAGLLFRGLDLTLEAGRWTCLLGASGAGKSTILRMIAGLDAHVTFDGQITAQDGAPLAGRVAYMAQSDLLLPWSKVIDNLCLGARLRGTRPDRARALRLLERVGLAEHAEKRPDALSGGQRQRAALARTLMEDRPVILLDEPFSALDARTRSEMQDLAVELLAGRTVLLVTHDPGEAARLGHGIEVLGPNGLTTVPPPSGAVPRSVDDPETLAMQGALLRRLREDAA